MHASHRIRTGRRLAILSQTSGNAVGQSSHSHAQNTTVIPTSQSDAGGANWNRQRSEAREARRHGYPSLRQLGAAAWPRTNGSSPCNSEHFRTEVSATCSLPGMLSAGFSRCPSQPTERSTLVHTIPVRSRIEPQPHARCFGIRRTAPRRPHGRCIIPVPGDCGYTVIPLPFACLILPGRRDEISRLFKNSHGNCGLGSDDSGGTTARLHSGTLETHMADGQTWGGCHSPQIPPSRFQIGLLGAGRRTTDGGRRTSKGDTQSTHPKFDASLHLEQGKVAAPNDSHPTHFFPCHFSPPWSPSLQSLPCFSIWIRKKKNVQNSPLAYPSAPSSPLRTPAHGQAPTKPKPVGGAVPHARNIFQSCPTGLTSRRAHGTGES